MVYLDYTSSSVTSMV